MRDIDEPAGVASADTDGYAIAYDRKLSKMTNVYVGYGAKSNDLSYANGGGDESMMTAGMRVKF